MEAVRILIKQHRRVAGLLLALALIVRLAVPAGFMPVATGHGIVLALCSGTGPMAKAMPMPGMAGDHHDQKGEKAESPCAFAGLTAPCIAGAGSALLAIAILFVLATRRLVPQRVTLPYRHTLRPPLRGPPAHT